MTNGKIKISEAQERDLVSALLFGAESVRNSSFASLVHRGWIESRGDKWVISDEGHKLALSAIHVRMAKLGYKL